MKIYWRYTFLGDAATRAELRGLQCEPIRDARGRCIVSVKMATAAVIGEDRKFHVVPRRRLRLNQNGAQNENR